MRNEALRASVIGGSARHFGYWLLGERNWEAELESRIAEHVAPPTVATGATAGQRRRGAEAGLKIGTPPPGVAIVSAAEILAELPKLSAAERPTVAAAIFDLDEEATVLHDCDRRADEHFQMLDAMENDDAWASSG